MSVGDQTIEVPSIAPGAHVLSNLALQQKAPGRRAVFLSGPDRAMEIVEDPSCALSGEGRVVGAGGDPFASDDETATLIELPSCSIS